MYKENIEKSTHLNYSTYTQEQKYNEATFIYKNNYMLLGS